MSQESTGILLVEDDIAFAQLATRMIASIAPDYQVDHESTLTRALARLDRQPYDAVLLDLGLPDSSGLDTLVACAGRAPSLPVVVLTSQADQSFARRAIQRGAQDYVLKGDVSPELLVKTRILSNRSPDVPPVQPRSGARGATAGARLAAADR